MWSGSGSFWQAPGPQHQQALQVRTREHRPSDAVFTEAKNINNMHSAPPVVSTRSRCVRESLCVYTCARTRTHGGWRWVLRSTDVFPGRLQSILTNTA